MVAGVSEGRGCINCTHLVIWLSTHLFPISYSLPPPSPTCPPAFANPADYAQKNAELKALDIATKLFREVDGEVKNTILVIGSDTMYVPPTEEEREKETEIGSCRLKELMKRSLICRALAKLYLGGYTK